MAEMKTMMTRKLKVAPEMETPIKTTLIPRLSLIATTFDITVSIVSKEIIKGIQTLPTHWLS